MYLYSKRKDANGDYYYESAQDYVTCNRELMLTKFDINTIFYKQDPVFYPTRPQSFACKLRRTEYVNDFIYRLLFDPTYISTKILFLKKIVDNIVSKKKMQLERFSITSIINSRGIAEEIRKAKNISKALHKDERYNLTDSVDFEESKLLIGFLQFVKRDIGLIPELTDNFDEETVKYANYVIHNLKHIYLYEKMSINSSYDFRFVFLMSIAECTELQDAVRIISDSTKFPMFLNDLISDVNDLKHLGKYSRLNYIFAAFITQTSIRYELENFTELIPDNEMRDKAATFKPIVTAKPDKAKYVSKNKIRKKKKTTKKEIRNRPAMICSELRLIEEISKALAHNSGIDVKAQIGLIDKIKS